MTKESERGAPLERTAFNRGAKLTTTPQTNASLEQIAAVLRETDDFVRKTIADGTAVYWKNSFGRISITEGSAENIDFATPSTDAGDVSVPPAPGDIVKDIRKLVSEKLGGR